MLHRPRRVYVSGSITATTVAFLVLAQTIPAWGWGHNGHRIVAKFAGTRLSTKARVALHDLLEDGEDIADASTWPDEHKTPSDAPWHFVNVPLEQDAYKDEFCDPTKSCVVKKIDEFRLVLKDPMADELDKRRALRFLIHLVGDIHQPLHVADNSDRGGNSLHVILFRRGTNLHAVWDEGLLMFNPDNDRDDLGRRIDEGSWVKRLDKFTTDEMAKKWLAVTKPSDWATESLVKAKVAYQNPRTGKIFEAGDHIDDMYEGVGLKIIEERLAQAGVRLADILNDVFGE
jgi:hypothetical protein